jgi:hypothetical protein
MAKGDHGRMQDEIGKQSDLTQHGYGYKAPQVRFGGGGIVKTPGTPGFGGMENLQKGIYDTYGTMKDNYKMGVDKSMRSYDDIMAAYKAFAGNQDLASARSTYGDLAGGGVNVGAMRERALAPVRASYSNARREVDRSSSLAGGNASNKNAALSRMARQESITGSQAMNDTEAGIQELISRNRAVGAGGMANLAGMDMANNNAMASLYSANPGLASTFGNQLLASQGDVLQGQGLQNQLAQILMNARAQNAQIPGNFQQALGNIGGVLNLGGQVAGGLVGLGGPKAIPNMSNPAGWSSSGFGF